MDDLMDFCFLTMEDYEENFRKHLKSFNKADGKTTNKRFYVFSQNKESNEIHIHECKKVRRIKDELYPTPSDTPLCGWDHDGCRDILSYGGEAYDAITTRRIAVAGQNGKFEICGGCVGSLYHTNKKGQPT